MEASSDTPSAIRFGTFELDIRSRELRKGDTRIRLQEQPFEILHLMLQRPGHVVTREELCERLWPQGTFVDFEHSLNAAVKRLRAALGDDADNPKFVETLPRRGYRFIAALDAGRASSEAAAEASDARLAVLPFSNLSEDPGQDYFSDGLTEELIAQLGPLCRGRIAVIARRSSMAFKGSSQRAREIAKVLSARYLLEGSVRRDGQRVRITARLIEGYEETELWCDTHDRTVDDWLSVQADVATHVARSLLVQLVPDQAIRCPVPDPRAHQAYVKGRYHWGRPADEGLADSLRCLDEAIRIAPEFGAAYALWARVTIGAAEYYRQPASGAFAAARAAAERALELDPANGEARVALADLHRFVDFDWRTAKDLYRDVLWANPSSEAAHKCYAFLLAVHRRHDEAIRSADLARQLDPLCTSTAVAAAWTRYMAGHYEEALAACTDALSLGGLSLPAVRLRAFTRVALGDVARAATELEQALERVGGDAQVLTALAYVYGVSGRRRDANQLISAVRELESAAYVSRYQLALAFVSVESFEAAFAMLEMALREHDPSAAYVAIEPAFEPARSDPRYAQVLDGLNLHGPTRIA